MRLFYIFLLFSVNLIPLCLEAQSNFVSYWGGQVGVSFSVGTHFQRIGLMSRVHYTHNWAQFNLQSTVHYNLKSLGSEKRGWAASFQPSFVGAWGKRDSIHSSIHPYLTPLSTQTARPYAIGYTYIIYIDQFSTSQLSGAMGCQIKNFRFYFENDFLAFTSEDKYRTGAIGLYYRINHWQISLKTISYTGNPYASFVPWIEEKSFPSVSGYIDMSAAPLGNKSMGVLALQLEYLFTATQLLNSTTSLPFDQYVGFSIGIDAEQIRNALQNKFIHDSKLLPLNWNEEKNPHIPMIAKDGCPYLYYDWQKIRPQRLYFQVHTNNPILY